MSIEPVSFGVATVLFLILGLVMLTGQRNNLPKKMLALACLSSSLWAGMVTWQAIYGGFLSATLLLELFRSLAWFAFLLVMLRTAYKTTPTISRHFRLAFTGITIFVIGLMVLADYRISGGSIFENIAGNDVLVGHLMISLGGLVMVEQLYRNTSEEHRWALKYLWMAIGGMFAYDFYLYSDALMYQRIDNELWNARGFIHGMVVPLIGVAIKREMQWKLHADSIDIFISRRMIFHTTTLLAAGVYLIIIGFGGYYVRDQGGSWGSVAQAIFIFGACLIGAILLFSGKVRSRMKVMIDKHFFHYKYDYREEWLRIIRTLSSGDGRRLNERVIKAMAQIIDSPGGILWLRNADGEYESIEQWNMEKLCLTESPNHNFIQFLQEQQFVISLDEYKNEPEVYTRLADLDIPGWLENMHDAWLIVPLMLNEALLGFVVLRHSPSHLHYFNWEDSDLLKTAGRQAANHLAQQEAARALADARRFEEFSRMSAFVVHDIKNMVGQLSLIVSNAAKHKNNPLFMEDVISTAENTVNKMNNLLSRLRGTSNDAHAVFNLCELLEEVISERIKTGARPVPVLSCQSEVIKLAADKDRMTANIGHIIQNAIDATNEDGRIMVRIRKQDAKVVIQVEDTGIGMDDDFIKYRLFQPFESTKGTMGIGVFQVREYVQKLGGEVQVNSEPGKGTTFTIILPAVTRGNVIQHPQMMKKNENKSA